MKKNIWILNHYATSTYFDRGGRHYWLAKILKKRGYNPIIFCSSVGHNGSEGIEIDKGLYTEKHLDNIQYIFVKTSEYARNGKKRILNMISFYRNVRKIAKEITITPDIILASSVHPLTLVAGLQIAKKFQIPCICEIRDLWPESLVAYGALKKNSLLTKLLYIGEKNIYKKADSLIMTWEGGKQYIIDKGWGSKIDLNKVTHISNGVFLEDFNLKHNYSDSDLDNVAYKNFVYTGSIRKVNNLGKLVDAARILKEKSKDARILIYGSGDEELILEETVKKESLTNIKFKGKVSKSLVSTIISKSYVNILHNSSTSLDKYGSSQNKLFEYLAAGKCILQTYSSDYNILTNNRSGITLNEQTPEEIANAILYLCENEEFVSEMGRNAKEVAKKYDFNLLTDKLINVIENI